MIRIIKTKDYQELSIRAARFISTQVSTKPNSVLGLATGSTPLGIYQELIADHQNVNLDFSKVHTVNLDEYIGLSQNHDQSYYYYMHHNLFSKINIPIENTHLPNGLAPDLSAECKAYDQLIENLGGIDLQLLGIGTTGHIGFNEPSTQFEKNTHATELTKQTIIDNSRFFADIASTPKSALTLGIAAIMQAKQILMVINGAAKAEILKAAFFGPVTPEVQASILQFHPNVIVVADEPALALLS